MTPTEISTPVFCRERGCYEPAMSEDLRGHSYCEGHSSEREIVGASCAIGTARATVTACFRYTFRAEDVVFALLGRTLREVVEHHHVPYPHTATLVRVERVEAAVYSAA